MNQPYIAILKQKRRNKAAKDEFKTLENPSNKRQGRRRRRKQEKVNDIRNSNNENKKHDQLNHKLRNIPIAITNKNKYHKYNHKTQDSMPSITEEAPPTFHLLQSPYLMMNNNENNPKLESNVKNDFNSDSMSSDIVHDNKNKYPIIPMTAKEIEAKKLRDNLILAELCAMIDEKQLAKTAVVFGTSVQSRPFPIIAQSIYHSPLWDLNAKKYSVDSDCYNNYKWGND